MFEFESTKSGVEIVEMASLRGWDINSILENNMQTSSQNLEIRGKITHAYELIEEKNYGQATAIVDELQSRTNGKHPDVVELRFLIHRGELKREAHK